jgi:hypothetical protein
MPDYTAITNDLSHKERLYVQAKLKGLDERAAAAAAGLSVTSAVIKRCQPVLEEARRLDAAEVGMTRDKLYDMLMEAWRMCVDAKEMVLVARSLAELYGLNAAKKIQVEQNNTTTVRVEQLKGMTLQELEKLAGREIVDAEFTVQKQLTNG